MRIACEVLSAFIHEYDRAGRRDAQNPAGGSPGPVKGRVVFLVLAFDR
jgi:hypothetical protein